MFSNRFFFQTGNKDMQRDEFVMPSPMGEVQHHWDKLRKNETDRDAADAVRGYVVLT